MGLKKMKKFFVRSAIAIINCLNFNNLDIIFLQQTCWMGIIKKRHAKLISFTGMQTSLTLINLLANDNGCKNTISDSKKKIDYLEKEWKKAKAQEMLYNQPI